MANFNRKKCEKVANKPIKTLENSITSNDLGILFGA